MKDLALVSELRLELAPGLTVLTGETGAGKSLLVDPLLAAGGSSKSLAAGARELQAGAAEWKRGTKR